MEHIIIMLIRIRDWAGKHSRGKMVLFIMSIILICALAMVIWQANQMVVFTDVSQYGHYTGTGADEFVTEYISSFFPEQIEDCFSDVKYSYKAAGRNAYDFEAYLEFTIADTDTFFRYVADIAPAHAWETFTFDADYQIYIAENYMDIIEGAVTDQESDLYHPIEGAKIKAVLYNTETQTIIFWALGVYDGGGIGTNFLSTFFERFQIDPLAYEKTADSSHGYDPFEID